MGKSKFKKISQDTELETNMLWAEKKPQDTSAKRLVEIIKEDGVATRYQIRDKINIAYFLDLESRIQEWPWAFSTGNVKGFL